ncbi:GtrA family protein [Consotaella salsifontis]|uniref:GtrA-like protein n=1 Tax=Consotaella salsifontis TaxID=1365950 RepID=A0A1T4P1N0_9HYPH|nr:GtrA family protein [Consotaella salsifontis]SJZ85361.1 GtrA-like protein [Consotaella salsifontis]
MLPRLRRIGPDAVRFLIAGGINTAITTAIYFAALTVLSPALSYALAWAVGIVFVAVVYPNKVFVGGRRQLRDRLAVGAVTIAVFLVGIVVVDGLTRAMQARVVPYLITLCLTTALNFILARTVLRR